MIIKFGIPLLAASALGFGVATTMLLRPDETLSDAPHPPPATTLPHGTVAGLGEVQSAGEVIEIGSPLSGIVLAAHVRTGERVRAGDPLFSLDAREQRAELDLRRSALAAARSRLDRLRAATREEDLAPARARREAADVAIERAADLLRRGETLAAQGALSVEELRSRTFAVRLAEAEREEARAELARLEAGSWALDIAVAEREVELAEADVAAAATQVERMTVRSPTDGIVLRSEIREGEAVQALAADRAPMVVAADGDLEVRVQIDEEDVGRVGSGAAAEGFLRGRERTRLTLAFVRIEPRVVPKTSITGDGSERVDTRVLHLVYRIVGAPARIYAGQKVDVFLEASVP